jgi:hypothetical protein
MSQIIIDHLNINTSMIKTKNLFKNIILIAYAIESVLNLLILFHIILRMKLYIDKKYKNKIELPQFLT